MLSNLSQIQFAALSSILAGLSTGLGAIPILFIHKLSQKKQDFLMGLSAGIMLAATYCTLMDPSYLEFAKYHSKVVAACFSSFSLALGALLLYFLHNHSPHQHLIKKEEHDAKRKAHKLSLLVVAITLHNVPEGLAVGVGAASNDIQTSIAITIGIALQNMPEGLIVALALIAKKESKYKALWVAFLTGMVEPVGSFVGFTFVYFMNFLLPWALALSAGAMLFVISYEMIPESHNMGHEKQATGGLILGFCIMFILSKAFS